MKYLSFAIMHLIINEVEKIRMCFSFEDVVFGFGT